MSTQRPTISLVIADTDTYNLAVRALQISAMNLKFDRVIVFSDDPSAWPGYPVVPVPTIRSLADYSRLILAKVVEHLETDFFVVVQFDGFVINGGEFSPHYFHYDYIGAPWPTAGGEPIVGNGGFSWRSRRLAEAVARLARDASSGTEIEDAFICLHHRTALETHHRCRFAPAELAVHFSIEGGEQRFPTFGFHGISYLPCLYQQTPEFLVDNLTPRILLSMPHYGAIEGGLRLFAPAMLQRLEARRSLCQRA